MSDLDLKLWQRPELLSQQSCLLSFFFSFFWEALKAGNSFTPKQNKYPSDRARADGSVNKAADYRNGANVISTSLLHPLPAPGIITFLYNEMTNSQR